MWNKHSCFETSMHAPLIVSAPHIKVEPDRPARVAALTEFIDIYPSLCELTGTSPPSHLQGTSFVPQMRNPVLPGKSSAVGRFSAGDTIRTERYRYSEYRSQRGLGRETGRMLYDHKTDAGENTNIVARDEENSTVSELSKHLNELKGKFVE